MSQVKSKLLNQKFFLGTLIRNVLLNTFGIRILAHRVRIETTSPQIPAPKFSLNFFMPGKDYRCNSVNRI